MKAKSFVEMSCVYVSFHNCIKLQYGKAKLFCFFHTVYNKFFPDMPATKSRAYSIACVAYMTASSDIIRMQNI